jgi:tol-pal system-associated acyl-CoA thioesterase
MEEHRFTVKVYLEDTDAIGIVYYANYLKFLERARSEFLEGLGVPAGDRQYVVHEMHIKFIKPSRMGDLLEVRSTARRASDYRVTFAQKVYLQGAQTLLVSAEVQVACVDSEGNLAEFPEGLLANQSG